MINAGLQMGGSNRHIYLHKKYTKQNFDNNRDNLVAFRQVKDLCTMKMLPLVREQRSDCQGN